jgi:hypothetical protein
MSRSSSGIPGGLSSRLVPRSYFTPKKAPGLVDAIQAGQKILLDAGTDPIFSIVFAPPTKRGTYNAHHTSINPVWYESLWHVIYAGEPPLIVDSDRRKLMFVMFVSNVSPLGIRRSHP